MNKQVSQMIDREEVIALLSELVSIKSVNTAYDADSSEKAISAYIENQLCQSQIPVETQQVAPNRTNVIGRLEGTSDRILLFEAHMDTVFVEEMTIPPFEPKRKGDRLYGRGSCDTKGGLAAMLYAIKAIKRSGVQPEATILFAATVDEEYSFQGIRHLAKSGIRADGAVVAEPTDLDIVIAHKGCLRWKIVTEGKASHSAKPHLGENAILKMAKVLAAIDQEILPVLDRKKHPLLDCATLSVGMIRGGVQVNVVPPRCEIELDRRLLPGETKDSVWNEFDQMFDNIKQADPSVEAVMETPMLEDWPLETNQEEPVVQVAGDACQQVLGRHQFIGVPFCTDASKLNRVGIPSIVLGPGSIDQAHGVVEFVSMDQVVQAAKIYAEMMLAF